MAFAVAFTVDSPKKKTLFSSISRHFSKTHGVWQEKCHFSTENTLFFIENTKFLRFSLDPPATVVECDANSCDVITTEGPTKSKYHQRFKSKILPRCLKRTFPILLKLVWFSMKKNPFSWIKWTFFYFSCHHSDLRSDQCPSHYKKRWKCLYFLYFLYISAVTYQKKRDYIFRKNFYKIALGCV